MHEVAVASIGVAGVMIAAAMTIVGYWFRPQKNGKGPPPGSTEICKDNRKRLSQHSEQIGVLREMAAVAIEDRKHLRFSLEGIDKKLDSVAGDVRVIRNGNNRGE